MWISIRAFSQHIFLISFLGGALQGCSLLPSPEAGPQLIQLTPSPVLPAEKSQPFFHSQLIVNRPQADHVWNTSRLALLTSPGFLEYYAGLAWTDRLPNVLQTLLLETFEQTGRFESVERAALGGLEKWILRTEIRSFTADYRRGMPPTIQIVVKVDLFHPETRCFIKNGLLTADVKAQSDTTQGIVDAFTKGTHKILEKIKAWTLDRLNEAALSSPKTTKHKKAL